MKLSPTYLKRLAGVKLKQPLVLPAGWRIEIYLLQSQQGLAILNLKRKQHQLILPNMLQLILLMLWPLAVDKLKSWQHSKKALAVTYLSKKTSWGQIKTPSGITGWVANRDLSTTRPEGTSDSDPVVETVSNDLLQYVTVDELNIREEGNASADKVGEVNRGDAVTVIQIGDNGWGEIITEDGLIGWVNLYYLSDSVPTDGLEGKVIVLDPGHGGKDPGALGDENKEKELTLSTAKKVKTKLEAAGAKVLMTRTGDTYPTLSDRVAFSKKNKADVFISIHFNSSSSSSANGIDTFYWTTYKNEKALATYVQKEVIESTGLNSRGVKTGNFQVIRENNMQAILIELGFISNPDEEAVIETSKFQNNAAEGIVNGLEAYFESL